MRRPKGKDGKEGWILYQRAVAMMVPDVRAANHHNPRRDLARLFGSACMRLCEKSPVRETPQGKGYTR